MLLVGWMVMGCRLLCETSDSLYSTPVTVCTAHQWQSVQHTSDSLYSTPVSLYSTPQAVC